MHWLLRDITEAEDSQAIVSFDLAAEKFREASTLESSEGTEFLGIGILDGCSLVYTVYWNWNGCFEAWAMKGYDMKSSWAKVLIIPGQLLPTPSMYVQLISMRNGKILLGLDWNETVLFGVEEGSCQFLPNTGWSDFRYEFNGFVESLVSPYLGQWDESIEVGVQTDGEVTTTF